MSLYTAPTGGNFIPYVKYNAKAGRWYVKGDNGEQEVVNPVFVADFKTVKRVWASFSEGQAPDIVEFETFESNVPRPSDKHKLGIKLLMFSKNSFGGVVEFVSTAANACEPIAALYDKYEKNAKPDEVPVVKVTGVQPVTGKHGTNYVPQFEIEKFIPRPAEFDSALNDNDSQEQVAAPAAASSVSEF